jgi:hypothetical protein
LPATIASPATQIQTPRPAYRSGQPPLFFASYVGLLPGRKLDQLRSRRRLPSPPANPIGNFDRVATLTPLGRQQVFDLTEPVTSRSSPTA